jgi:ankyrin repeat protein
MLLDTGKVDVDAKDYIGQTPLWWAAMKGHEAVVKMLVDTGKVDVDAEDEGGWTPVVGR